MAEVKPSDLLAVRAPTPATGGMGAAFARFSDRHYSAPLGQPSQQRNLFFSETLAIELAIGKSAIAIACLQVKERK